MSNGKKALNVVGIVFASLLSIVLVILLIISPLVLSALSLLDAQTITKALTGAVTSQIGGDSAAENYQVVTLSNAPTDGSTDISKIGEDALKSILGEDVSQEALGMILSSNVAKEVLEAYTQDMTNAFAGKDAAAQFNAEKIKSIINENMDEVVDILQKVSPESANLNRQELEDKIRQAIDEGAEQMVQALPAPKDIQESVAEGIPALATAFEILAKKNTIKLAIIGVLVVLSGLIFLCRLWQLRGFKWLAVDLFIGGGFNALTSVGLLVSASAVEQIAAQDAVVGGLVGSLLSELTTGMWVRTAVMLVAGGGLLAAYIFIKKAREQKEIPAEVPAEDM